MVCYFENRHWSFLLSRDVGGQKTIRAYWRNYFEQTDGIIWVNRFLCDLVIVVRWLIQLIVGDWRNAEINYVKF